MAELDGSLAIAAIYFAPIYLVFVGAEHAVVKGDTFAPGLTRTRSRGQATETSRGHGSRFHVADGEREHLAIAA